MDNGLVAVFAVGMAGVLAHARVARLVKSGLYATVVFNERNNLARAFIGACATFCSFALIVVGFLLFPWWIPIAAFLVFSFLAAIISMKHIETHLKLMDAYAISVIGAAIFLWLQYLDLHHYIRLP